MSGSPRDRQLADRLLLITLEAGDSVAKGDWTQAGYLLEERGRVIEELIEAGFGPEAAAAVDKSGVLAEQMSAAMRGRRSEIAGELKKLAGARRAIQSYL